MPELSRFYGIIIYMFVKDHHPPHFHAKYGEFKDIFCVKTGELLEGEPPRRAQRMIKEGAGLHQDELMKNWDSTQSETPEFRKIQPLQ